MASRLRSSRRSKSASKKVVVTKYEVALSLPGFFEDNGDRFIQDSKHMRIVKAYLEGDVSGAEPLWAADEELRCRRFLLSALPLLGRRAVNQSARREQHSHLSHLSPVTLRG